MSVECQVNVKSQSELDIGGRETCGILIESMILTSPGQILKSQIQAQSQIE